MIFQHAVAACTSKETSTLIPYSVQYYALSLLSSLWTFLVLQRRNEELSKDDSLGLLNSQSILLKTTMLLLPLVSFLILCSGNIEQSDPSQWSSFSIASYHLLVSKPFVWHLLVMVLVHFELCVHAIRSITCNALI